MNKNTHLVYVIAGFLVGILITIIFFHYKKVDTIGSNPTGIHQMPDGTLMNDDGMSMSSMMDGMMAGLEGKTGDEFDKAFLSEMITHHQGAVEMAKAVLKTSKRPELIKLANDIISAQTKEIEMMKGWQKIWFK